MLDSIPYDVMVQKYVLDVIEKATKKDEFFGDTMYFYIDECIDKGYYNENNSVRGLFRMMNPYGTRPTLMNFLDFYAKYIYEKDRQEIIKEELGM